MTDSFLDDAGNVIKVVPELYEDGLQSTVQESGKTIALVPKAINAALVPLRKWIAKQEYSLQETDKLLAEKLKNIPVEKITTPEGYVGVPALQAIAYSMDSEELRELYANLLASAMDTDMKDKAHPSFVELIKQMSPNDAIVFKIIYEAPVAPVVDLCIRAEPKDGDRGGDFEHVFNITWIKNIPYEKVLISLDNLLRLGLIEIPFGLSYAHKENYEIVKSNPEYTLLRQKLEELNRGSIKVDEKVIRKTALADSFYETCVKGATS